MKAGDYLSNVYLFFGEEKYDLEQRVEKIKRNFTNLEVGLNMFYLNKENIDELPGLIQGVTFFGSEKLIIIKDTGLKFNVELLNGLDEEITIIIIEDSVDKRISEYKKLSKMAECVEFKYLDQKQMVDYIMTILKKCNLKISLEDAQYLQSICGESKANNINELQKLSIYLEPSSTVTKEIIDTVCSKTLNAKIFDVLSLIVNKKVSQALIELDDLLEQKESVVKIYIMLYKQIKQMYMIKYLKQKNIPDISKTLGIHPFVYKNLSKSCDYYTLDKLKNIIYEFDEYDEKTKLGEMDFEIGLKKIICIMGK